MTVFISGRSFLLASVILSGCQSTTGANPSDDGEVPPPPPPPFRLILFDVNSTTDPSGRSYSALRTGAQQGASSAQSPVLITDAIVVYENSAWILGKHIDASSHGFDTADTQKFYFDEGAGYSIFTSISILKSGEVDADYDSVSIADISQVYCPLFDGCILKDPIFRYFYLFGDETVDMPSSGSATYLGEWHGLFVRSLGGDNIDLTLSEFGEVFGYEFDGIATIDANFNGAVTGTLTADPGPFAAVSNFELSGTAAGTSISGNTSAILTTDLGDFPLNGSFEGMFFGSEADEVGGLIVMSEDHVTAGTVDPLPTSDYEFFGVFVAD